MFRFSPLAPGIWLMRRLRLPTKLGVLSSVLVVPLLVICVLLVQRLGEDIRLAENEADGVQLISLMADVVQSVQTHRGQTNMLLSGNTAVRGALDKTRGELTRSLAATRALVDELTVLVCWLPDDPIAGAVRLAWMQDLLPDCRVLGHGAVVPQAPEDSAPRIRAIA